MESVLPIEQDDEVLQVPGEALLSNGNAVGTMGTSSSQSSRFGVGVEGRVVGFSGTVAKCVEQRRGLFSSKSSSNSVRVFCLRRSPLLWRDGIIRSRGRCWPWCERAPGLVWREGEVGEKRPAHFHLDLAGRDNTFVQKEKMSLQLF